MTDHSRATEQALARRARGGSVAAFGEIVGLHHAAVFAFLLALTRHRQDAEDLTQETFVRAWAKFSHYDAAQPMIPWLCTIARRLSIAAMRRCRPVPAEAVAPPDEAPPDRALLLWETAKSMLTPDAYAALWLHYHEELPIQQIAKIMGKRQGTVKVTLHRARKTLAESLRGTSSVADFPCDFPHPQQLTP